MDRELILILILALLSATIAAPAPVKARTIIVPIDFPDIQTALDNAIDGDVITVLNGVYGGFEVKKSVSIIGESNQTVVVNGSVTIIADNVKISSMRIVLKEPSIGFASAIVVFGSNVLLNNVLVESDASGVQIGDLSHTDPIVSIEHVSIIAGRKGDYLGKPAGVWGICSSLLIYSSNITLLKDGIGVSGCGHTQLMFNNIRSEGNGVKIGNGEIRNNTIIASKTGVLASGNNILIEYNLIKSNGIGIDVFQSNENNISENSVSGLETGIRLIGGYNSLTRNKVSSSGSAIELRGDNNILMNNTLSGSRGVNGLYGYGNTIAFNLINMTGSIGIYMSGSTGNNIIYGNTFWYCYNYNAADESGGNQWYVENGNLKMGNYWYDHTSPDNNGDGIVDEPYVIATITGLQILDKYPLANPVGVRWHMTSTLTNTMNTVTSNQTETPDKQIGGSEEQSVNLSYYIAIAGLAATVIITISIILVFKRRR